MSDLVNTFAERLQEVEAYLDFLKNVEDQAQAGPPRLGSAGPVVTPQQQKILYSCVYLQLYNLVESTVTNCVDAFSSAAVNGQHRPGQLSTELRREWVRYIARTHTDLNYENRLNAALRLCQWLIDGEPLTPFRVEKGGGGNWDDDQIEAISGRLGLVLRVDRATFERVKRPFKNDKGALVFIKALRNDLAHGTVSFAESGDGVTVHDLRELKDRTSQYLREVVAFFAKAIADQAFLHQNQHRAGVSA